jgi:hypothetical protein
LRPFISCWPEIKISLSSDFVSIIKGATIILLPSLVLPPHPLTVKKFDEVVQHLHLVTQDQFTLMSEKVFGIPEENFAKNIELF